MTIQQIQQIVGVTPDGINGPKTKAAIKEFQKILGVKDDGIWGSNTQAAYDKLINQRSNNTTPNNTTPNNTGYTEDYNKPGDTPTSLYGAETRNSDWERPALQEEQAIIKSAVRTGIINSSFLNTITSDPSLVGFYVNALAYGGYTIGDVLNDMKRRELISQGNNEAKSLKIIDPELNRNSYTSTAEGQKSITDSAKIIPTFNLQGLLNPEILKYGTNIPDELFKTLVPIVDRNSQEFKDAVEKIKATYYDLASASLQASTEQEKAVADYNLQKYKEQLNQIYGIQLSDDATKAWSQIESLENTMSARNISGSGIENEEIDNILKTTRAQDQKLRLEKLSREEAERASYYTTSASASEIASLSPEEKVKYGLTPSSEILNKFSVSNLKAQYPNKSDKEIQAIHDAVIDENGNYRSSLYSKYYSQLANTAISNQTNAEQQVFTDALNKENTAYRNYDNSQNFSVATPKDDTIVKNNAPVTTTQTSSNNIITPEISKNITTAINNFNSNTGKQLSPNESYINASGQKITQGTPYTPPPVNTSSNNSQTSTTTTTPPSGQPSTSSPNTYKISYGDTLSKIAAKNKTTVAALAKLNNISNPDKIQAGQIIKFQ